MHVHQVEGDCRGFPALPTAGRDLGVPAQKRPSIDGQIDRQL
ncbi:hypothetical protein M6B38_313355 [Iris pallida]|uniref:Uncharacterized protein n=1 Tax=Iris pallida TaxID=29817 RepID=A0AAX6DGV5_IRIPA|nr:hypothetical protein M6B38_246285 [Iris pallida]KAJ6839793.1 hypothetical protein M6B38_313355 [Iris pallida]